jgi:hypothetical protein
MELQSDKSVLNVLLDKNFADCLLGTFEFSTLLEKLFRMKELKQLFCMYLLNASRASCTCFRAHA